MELRQLVIIFRENIKLLLGAVIFFILAGLGIFFFQPELYSANLMLNVTRKGIQETPDYRYDDFYRLQADEKFADTVVSWLGSAQIIQEIHKEAGIEKMHSIKAKRLSSQAIETVFVLEDKDDAPSISEATLEVLNRQTEKLDEFQKEKTWFTLVSNEPAVSSKKLGFPVIFSATFLLGLFFGFWGVMIANYLKRQ